MAGSRDGSFEELLEYLRQTRGFDFSGYKRAGLERRVRKRMSSIGIEEFEAYEDYLEVHPDEFGLLFNAILINVTGFFRDPQAWEYLEKEILPRILGGKRPDEPIRIWSAGCASGEETYSIAMLLIEALGIDQFQARVKLYATDVDENALAYARQASYTAREVSVVPPELCEKYFERLNGRYVFRKDLRRVVIFGRHDLVQDAPISRVDLLVCRNTLMYFNGDGQSKILARFHFALADDGFIFLGKAEMLLTHADIFTPVDLKWRVFAKARRSGLRERLLTAVGEGDRVADRASVQVQIRETAFNAGPIAQVVVDRTGLLALANSRARAMFGLAARDIGRPVQDLELSYRPAELRSCIEQAYAERRTIALREVERAAGAAAATYFDIDVVPLLGGTEVTSDVLGVSISFADMTEQRRLREEVFQSRQELETAYEELQSTNEELETTNEELQSTIEELETTNEELQSTNEELETMNEELQSTNEELETVNEELRDRSEDLNQANAFLRSILGSLRGGVAVVDRELLVDAWNHRAEDLWGLRANEVQGKHFMNLDIGLPVEKLRPVVRNILAGDSDYYETTLDATNRRGKAIPCTITCTPLLGPRDEVRGAILMMEEREASGPVR